MGRDLLVRFRVGGAGDDIPMPGARVQAALNKKAVSLRGCGPLRHGSSGRLNRFWFRFARQVF
jgi:hypothetical protein